MKDGADDVIDDGAPSMEELQTERRLKALRHLHHIIVGIPGQDERDIALAHLRVLLSDAERADLVQALIATFPADVSETVVKEAFDGAGFPTPSLMPGMLDDARLWATDANANEIKAYAMACVEKMSSTMLSAFAAWVEKRKRG